MNEKYNPMGEVSYNQLSTRTKVEMQMLKTLQALPNLRTPWNSFDVGVPNTESSKEAKLLLS